MLTALEAAMMNEHYNDRRPSEVILNKIEKHIAGVATIRTTATMVSAMSEKTKAAVNDALVAAGYRVDFELIENDEGDDIWQICVNWTHLVRPVILPE